MNNPVWNAGVKKFEHETIPAELNKIKNWLEKEFLYLLKLLENNFDKNVEENILNIIDSFGN